jgi:hypothetical protein
MLSQPSSAMLHLARFVVLPILLMVAADSPAAEKPVISLAMPYADGRARLFQTGFRPYRPIPHDSALFKKKFAGREDIGRLYPEAAQCEPKGKSACFFLWVRAPDEIVAITTSGAKAEALIVWHVRAAAVQEVEDLYAD